MSEWAIESLQPRHGRVLLWFIGTQDVPAHPLVGHLTDDEHWEPRKIWDGLKFLPLDLFSHWSDLPIRASSDQWNQIATAPLDQRYVLAGRRDSALIHASRRSEPASQSYNSDRYPALLWRPTLWFPIPDGLAAAAAPTRGADVESEVTNG